MAAERTNIAALVPGLEAWNDGAGISPQGWIGCVGSHPLAIGSTEIPAAYLKVTATRARSGR